MNQKTVEFRKDWISPQIVDLDHDSDQIDANVGPN